MPEQLVNLKRQDKVAKKSDAAVLKTKKSVRVHGVQMEMGAWQDKGRAR